jgi:hypothetical protein
MDQGKKRRRLRVPSPAMIVACVALFVALGGTSYAAIKLPANSVGTKQIKKSAVTAVKVKDATLTGAKIKDASLTGAKIQDATLTGAKLADGAVTPAKFGGIPGARVRRVAAFTVQDNVTAVLSYDTTDFNVGGAFSAAQPNRMTATVAGRYLITASVRWASNSAGRRALALEVNGTAAQIARSNVSPFLQAGAAFNPEQTVETVYQLKAGDYVEVWAFQNSGGPLGLQSPVDNGITFSMVWIAP